MLRRATFTPAGYPAAMLLTRSGAQAARKTRTSLAGLVRSMSGMGYVSSGPAADAAIAAGYNYQNGEWYTVSGTPVSSIAGDSAVSISAQSWDIFAALGYAVTAQRFQPLNSCGAGYQMEADGCHKVFDGSQYADPAAAWTQLLKSNGVQYTASGYSYVPASAAPYQSPTPTAAAPATITPAAPAPIAPLPPVPKPTPVYNVPGTFNYQSPQGVITTGGLPPIGQLLGTPITEAIGSAVSSAVNSLPAGPIQDAAAAVATAGAKIPAWLWAALAAGAGYMIFRKGGRK